MSISIVPPPIISFFMQKSKIMFKILMFPGIHIYKIGFKNLYYYSNKQDYIYINYKYSLICENLVEIEYWFTLQGLVIHEWIFCWFVHSFISYIINRSFLTFVSFLKISTSSFGFGAFAFHYIYNHVNFKVVSWQP
jgi:hypothetical protein